MKFNKLLTKTIAAAAMSTMLFSAVVSASTIKVPNMGGVSTQYAAMVQAANKFDDKLGNLIVSDFVKACYTQEAINTAISNTNLAINAINNIRFISTSNNTLDNNQKVKGLVRDNGWVAQANSYLKAAQLDTGISFSLSPSSGFLPTTDSKKAVDEVVIRPTSEYYAALNFVVSTRLYSAGTPTKIVIPTIYDDGDYKEVTDTAKQADSVKIENFNKVVDTLNYYVAFLNSLKSFDQAAGCYDTTTNTTQAPSNTTQAPVNTTQAPTSKNATISARNKTINAGDTFRFMDGVTAKDGNGTDITKKVTVSGKVNTAIPGKYSIKYSVKGSNGVVVTKTTTVTVK